MLQRPGLSIHPALLFAVMMRRPPGLGLLGGPGGQRRQLDWGHTHRQRPPCGRSRPRPHSLSHARRRSLAPHAPLGTGATQTEALLTGQDCRGGFATALNPVHSPAPLPLPGQPGPTRMRISSGRAALRRKRSVWRCGRPVGTVSARVSPLPLPFRPAAAGLGGEAVALLLPRICAHPPGTGTREP